MPELEVLEAARDEDEAIEAELEEAADEDEAREEVAAAEDEAAVEEAPPAAAVPELLVEAAAFRQVLSEPGRTTRGEA